MELSGGSIDALGDDNLSDILVRLDALFVLRCRAVCKRWRRIATDRSFLAAHAAARPREMIVQTEYGYVHSTVPLSPTNDDDDGLHRYLFEPRPLLAADMNSMCAGDLTVYASLDGLLVLKLWHDRLNILPFTYVICNPVTRQWANLPVPAPRRGYTDVDACGFYFVDACGFYFHASSGEYRLLLHCGERAPRGRWVTYCSVLSVGAALPRPLPCPPPSGELVYESPVSCRETLHWLSGHPQSGRASKMLAFDTFSETFRLMPPPPGGPQATTETQAAESNLLELDGELSVATLYGMTLDIWALQDYEVEKWTLRHRLKVRPPPPRRLWKPRPIFMGNALRGSASSSILVGFPPTREVMAYSLKDNNKVDKEINFGGLISFKVFSESLVPHDFLDSPDTPVLWSFSNPLFN